MGVQIRILLLFMVTLLISCSDKTLRNGDAALKLGDYILAEDFYRAVLKENPVSFDARLGLGKALLQKSVHYGTDTLIWREALIQFEAARTLNADSVLTPLLTDSWSVYADALVVHGDTLGALKALARAIDYTPSNSGLIHRTAVIYFKRGELKKASLLFRKLLENEPDNALYHYNLGIISLQNEKIEQAHRSLLKAMQLSPNDSDIIYWFSYAEMKRRESVGK